MKIRHPMGLRHPVFMSRVLTCHAYNIRHGIHKDESLFTFFLWNCHGIRINEGPTHVLHVYTHDSRTVYMSHERCTRAPYTCITCVYIRLTNCVHESRTVYMSALHMYCICIHTTHKLCTWVTNCLHECPTHVLHMYTHDPQTVYMSHELFAWVPYICLAYV